ncbi:PilZ domain-containing protein [Methylorubrum populi]|uniref:PilZ domain-containing protein n=1 Tax=Methylorubrum populi TaxID=223967 RepID=A0A921JDP6_9HYPH|nr:PilZ domain-containing protein [Methylorubrum populi]
MTVERRQELRKRSFLKGRIHFNKGASSMDCLVRDFSDAGARLELSETRTLPESFDLYIPQKETTLRATLRWLREGDVGVAFDTQKPASSEPAADPSLAVLLRRIAELEAENAALRSVIATKEAASGATLA